MTNRKDSINPLQHNSILKIHKFIFLTEKLLDRELRKGFTVSFSQFRMLSVIACSPGISQKKIALIQETTEAAVSRHIDVLQKLQYVALTTNSNNRKEHNLHLTKSGKSLHGKTIAFVDVKVDTLLDMIGEEKRLELSDVFDVLVDSVRREYGDNLPCED
jgi:DNA-binding MarR family transcriptional regulator